MVTGLTLLYVHCRNSVSPSISDQGAIEVKTDGLRAEDVKKTLLNDFRRVSDSDSQDRKLGSTPQNVLTKGGHRGEGVPASPQGEPAVSPPQGGVAALRRWRRLRSRRGCRLRLRGEGG